MKQLPFTEVRSTVPLTDADFDAIRAKVMTEVGRRKKRAPLVFRFAFAAVVIALLIVGVRQMWGPASAGRERPAEAGPHPAVVRAAVIHQEPKPAVLHAKSRHHRTPPRAAAPQTALQIHMEIQTADPDIRIIWITNETR